MFTIDLYIKTIINPKSICWVLDKFWSTS